MKYFLTKIDNAIEKLSISLLVVSVLAMLSLSVLNIFLRWFNTTLFWIEPLVRHLVFLSAFLGGVLATGNRSHIGIDILHRWLEGKKDSFISRLILQVTCFVSICTLAWLVYAAIEFVKTELEFGRDVFWGIHSGFLVGIIPFGFLLILVRFIIIFLLSFLRNLSNWSISKKFMINILP